MGRVHITSGLDPYANLDFESGFLDEWVDLPHQISVTNLTFICSPADVVTLRWAYKHNREIARRMKFYHGDLQVGHPAFPEGSQAATQPAGTPVEISASKIFYTKEDDDAIDEYHRRSGSYTWYVWIFASALNFVA